jgi:predicted ArsR family transcriptional regulator
MDYLGSKQIGTAPGIARALNITAANVRHHLSILLEEGAIEIVGERRAGGRGRPSFLYALSGHTHQHNLDRLSSALLEELLSQNSNEEISLVLKRITKRLLKDYKISSALTQRLYQAVQRLNDMHYDARWEARAEAPFVILGFCPYASILHDHPELCELDGLLIEALLTRPVRQVDKLARDERGMTCCRFMIQEG